MRPIPRRLIARCVVPIAAGGGIYLLRRPTVLPAELEHVPLVAAFLMSGPGLLWMFATVSWLRWLWRGQPGWEAPLWITSAVVMGVGVELSQLWGWIGGTFDEVDLLLNMAGAMAAMVMQSTGDARCGDAEP